jgi:hypothetical protein
MNQGRELRQERDALYIFAGCALAVAITLGLALVTQVIQWVKQLCC